VTNWVEDPGSDPAIGISRNAGVARIAIRRPGKLNAIDHPTSRALLTALKSVAADETVRSVLLTGEGRAFCAGADIGGAFEGPNAREAVEANMRGVTKPIILTLRSMKKPVIAAVNGPAVGVGCSIALACDLVLAAESAYFLLAFANLGLTADGGSSMLVPARVGLGRAFVLTMLAERLAAAEALAWGLADRVVPDADFVAATEALASRLAAGPTRSYAATKDLINRAQLSGIAEQLDRETDHQGELLDSADFAGAVRAFAKKTRPDFAGR
jgi:2-(1,2-epoxy-1,2-dihydrophenyl)acetyl-CoA isomerase